MGFKRIAAATYAAVFALSIVTSTALTLLSGTAYAAGSYTIIDTLQAYDVGRPYEDNIGYASSARKVAQAFVTGDKAGTVQQFVFQDYYSNNAHSGFEVRIHGSDGDGLIDEASIFATFGSNSTAIDEPEYAGGNPQTYRVLTATSDDFELQANTRYWVVVTLSAGQAVWRQSNINNNSGEGSIPNATPSRSILISGQNDGQYMYNSAGASYHVTYSNPAFRFNFRLTAVEVAAPDHSPTVTTGNATSITGTSATLNGTASGWDSGMAMMTERGFEYGLSDAYGSDTSETYTEGSLASGSYSQTITNLQCGTTYHFRAYAVTAQYESENEFYGEGDDNTFTTFPCTDDEDEEPAEDADNDGIPDSTEDGAPNNGDGNNDGIADSEQSNVTSFVNGVTGRYSTLAVDDDCTVDAVSGIKGSASHPDRNFEYPLGLLNFTLSCGTPGATIEVEAYHFDTDESDLVLRKYNSVNKTYWTIQNAAIQKVSIGGVSAIKAVYQITDGGDLDLDGDANGTIVDPVGLARSVVGAPNTGLGRSR